MGDNQKLRPFDSLELARAARSVAQLCFFAIERPDEISKSPSSARFIKKVLKLVEELEKKRTQEEDEWFVADNVWEDLLEIYKWVTKTDPSKEQIKRKVFDALPLGYFSSQDDPQVSALALTKKDIRSIVMGGPAKAADWAAGKLCGLSKDTFQKERRNKPEKIKPPYSDGLLSFILENRESFLEWLAGAAYPYYFPSQIQDPESQK
jgi:hypothetical protein